MSSINRCLSAVIRASPSRIDAAPGESSSVISRRAKRKTPASHQRRGYEIFNNELTTAERFSSTTKLSSGGRALNPDGTKNQYRGRRLLKRLVRRRRARQHRWGYSSPN